MNNAFVPNPAGYPVRPIIRPSGHQSALKIIFAIFAIMIALLLQLVVLLLIGSQTVLPDVIRGMLCARVQAPVSLMLLPLMVLYDADALVTVAAAAVRAPLGA